MTEFRKTPLTRRTVLGAGLAGAGLLAMPAVLRAQDKSLKVGVYGGYFKDSFDKNIFPEFTKATGIAVESVAEPTGEAWLVQLEQAAKAGQAPADVSMMSQTSTLKGQSTELWTPLDTSKIKHYGDLLDRFVNKYPDGRVAGIGAVAWYITLVTNTKVYPTAPDFLGGALGSGQRRQARPAGARLQLVPARGHGQDLLGRHQCARHRGRHPQGVREARRGEAERPALVSRRGAVRAGAEVGRDPDGPVLSRRHRARRRRRTPGALDLPEGRRHPGFRLLGAVAGLDQGRGGACLHRLYEPAGDPGPDVAQGRHLADAEDAKCST